MDCLSNHLFWFGRMERRRSPARPPGGRCLGRRTSGAWPPTPPRPCLLTSVPQPSPRPPLPWERFRVMVSLTRDLWHPRSHVRVCSAHVSPRGASQFRRCVKTCHSIRRYSHEEHDRNRGKRPASSDQVQLFCTTKRDEWVSEVCWAWSQGFQCHKGGSPSTWLHRHGNLYVAPYLVFRVFSSSPSLSNHFPDDVPFTTSILSLGTTLQMQAFRAKFLWSAKQSWVRVRKTQKSLFWTYDPLVLEISGFFLMGALK